MTIRAIRYIVLMFVNIVMIIFLSILLFKTSQYDTMGIYLIILCEVISLISIGIYAYQFMQVFDPHLYSDDYYYFTGEDFLECRILKQMNNGYLIKLLDTNKVMTVTVDEIQPIYIIEKIIKYVTEIEKSDSSSSK